MSLQLINLGQAANDRTGDELRAAFQKINENLTFLSSKHSLLFNESLPEGFYPDLLHVKSGILEMSSNNISTPFSLPWFYIPKYFVLRLLNLESDFGSPELFMNGTTLFSYDDSISSPYTFYTFVTYIQELENQAQNSFGFSINGANGNTFEFDMIFEKAYFTTV